MRFNSSKLFKILLEVTLPDPLFCKFQFIKRFRYRIPSLHIRWQDKMSAYLACFSFFQAKWPLPDWNFCWFTAIRACNIVFILLKNHSLFSSILKNNKAHPLFWTMRHPLRGSIANRNRTDHLFIRANLDVFLYGVFTYIQCNYSVQPGRYWALTALIDISLQFLFILSCNRFVGIGTNWTAFFHCFY